MGIIKIIDRGIVDERESSNTKPDLGDMDAMQWHLGAYYVKDQDTISKISAGSFHRAWLWDVEEGEEQSIRGLFPGKEQRIKIRYVGNGTLKDASETELKQWLTDSMEFNRTFSNHGFTISTPSMNTDPEVMSESTIDVESFYNYEFYNYETISTALNPKVLPSYLLFDYAQNALPYNPEKSNFILSYNEEIPYNSEQVAVDIQDNRDANLYAYNRSIPQDSLPASDVYRWEVKRQANNYFKLFTDTMIDDEATANLSLFENKNSNIFVHYDYKSTFLDYLPHWNRIRIPELATINWTYGPTEITAVSYDTTLIDEALIRNRLIKFLFVFMKNREPTVQEFYYTKITSADEGSQNLAAYSTALGASRITELKKLKTWDLTEWWRTEAFDSLPEGEDETFLLSEEDLDLLGEHAVLERRCRKVIALGMVRATLEQTLHNFKNCVIQNHNKAKSIIGFKVEKFLVSSDNDTREPIQTIYFEKSEGAIDFIDTQASFDTKYYYSISAITIVVGSSYSYDNLQMRSDSDGPYAEFDFVTSPSLRIVELPLEEIQTRIIEPPPKRPMVRVSNEKFIKNKVKFFIQDSLGNAVDDYALEKYVKINTNDSIYYDKLIESYSRQDERFFYSSRASTGIFEVFRIDKKPEKYSDFAAGYLTKIQSQTNLSIDAFNSSEFIDFIEHEKKYYYLFRALTPWSRSSNPSYIFEVYLIQDADEVKMILDAYHLAEPETRTDTEITMRRFLQVVPNSQHLEVNPDNNLNADGIFEADPNNLKLGSLGIDSDLWAMGDYSKKFIKLRLTSKTSGKKMDLNLIFKVVPESEQN